MQKSLLIFAMVLVLAISVTGCATTGDLEKVQAQEKQIGAKADQAALDAQGAKAAVMEALARLAATEPEFESVLRYMAGRELTRPGSVSAPPKPRRKPSRNG